MIPTNDGGNAHRISYEKPQKKWQTYILNTDIWAFIVVGIGIASLVGWIISFRPLATIISHSFSVSPISGILFIIFGLCLFFNARIYKDSIYALMQYVLLIISSILICWVFIDAISGYPINTNWSLSSSSQLSLLSPESQMAPMSAFLFLLMITSVLLGQRYPIYRQCSSFIIGATGGFLVLSYLYNTPFLYGYQIKPVSFLTSLGFLCLGTGFFLTNLPLSLNRIMRGETGRDHALRRIMLLISIIFLIYGKIMSCLSIIDTGTHIPLIAIMTWVCILITIVYSIHISK